MLLHEFEMVRLTTVLAGAVQESGESTAERCQGAEQQLKVSESRFVREPAIFY